MGLHGQEPRANGAVVGRTAVTVLLATGLLLGGSGRVATAACDPHRPADGHYYWVGRGQTLGNVSGVRSTIKTYDAFVKGNGFSYAWVMLPGPANHEWAQIGPYDVSSGSRSTYVQWMSPSDSSPHGMDFPSWPVGSNVRYTVTFNNGTRKFTFRDDSGILVTTPAIWEWTPGGAHIFAEIWQLSSQLMGDSSNKEIFNNNQVAVSGGAWQAFNGVLYSYDMSHFSFGGTNSLFNTWDLCQ